MRVNYRHFLRAASLGAISLFILGCTGPSKDDVTRPMLDNLFMDFEKKITTSIKKETDSTKSELRSDFNDTIKNRTLDMVKGVHLEGELKKHKDNLTDYFNNSLDTIRRECSKNTEKRGLIEKLEIEVQLKYQ